MINPFNDIFGRSIKVGDYITWKSNSKQFTIGKVVHMMNEGEQAANMVLTGRDEVMVTIKTLHTSFKFPSMSNIIIVDTELAIKWQQEEGSRKKEAS